MKITYKSQKNGGNMNFKRMLAISVYLFILGLIPQIQAQEHNYSKWLTGWCMRAKSYIAAHSREPRIVQSKRKDDTYVQYTAEIQDPLTNQGCGKIRYSHKVDLSKAKIQTLQVDRYHRKKGYGQKLIEYALRDLQLAGCRSVKLKAKPQEGTTQDQIEMLPRLIALYEKCGGVVTRVREEIPDANMKFDLTKVKKPLSSNERAQILHKIWQSEVISENLQEKEMERYYDYQ